MGNLYGDHPDIEFVNTFEGHADYYEGDDATGELLEEWLGTDRHDVIAAHFSGPDKVGHKWGIVSDEYPQQNGGPGPVAFGMASTGPPAVDRCGHRRPRHDVIGLTRLS